MGQRDIACPLPKGVPHTDRLAVIARDHANSGPHHVLLTEPPRSAEDGTLQTTIRAGGAVSLRVSGFAVNPQEAAHDISAFD